MKHEWFTFFKIFLFGYTAIYKNSVKAVPEENRKLFYNGKRCKFAP